MSTPTRRRTTSLWVTLLVAGTLLTGCGSSEPEPLEAAEPEVPADLCATIPEDLPRALIDGYLYQRILDRVVDHRLRPLAKDALVLRRLSVPLITRP